MACVAYIANGFCRRADAVDRREGFSELRIFNPLPSPVELRMKLFYADRPPVDLPPFRVAGYGNPLLVFPDSPWEKMPYREYFENCGAWGMRIVSETPLIMDHYLSAGIQGPPDKIKYRGGVADTLAIPRLSRLWYFSDGIKIVQPDLSTAPFPFNEYEWYHILNPNPDPARIRVQMFRWDGRREEETLVVPPERVLFYDNFDRFDSTIGFGMRFISDRPIALAAERMIYGENLDDWGAYIHCSRPAAPAPLDFNEEDAL